MEIHKVEQCSYVPYSIKKGPLQGSSVSPIKYSSHRPNLLDFRMIFLRTNNFEAGGKEQKETSAKEDIFAG